MREEKTLRYYLFVYLLSLGGLFVYLTYQAWRNDGYDGTLIYSLLWIPIFVTMFVFFIDKITDLFRGKKRHTDDQKQKEYIDYMAKAIDEENDLLVEDYRKLKESHRFQKGLHQAYQIAQNGETKELSFEYIIKKYPKQSIEYKAMLTVIDKTKEYMKNNQQSDK